MTSNTRRKKNFIVFGGKGAHRHLSGLLALILVCLCAVPKTASANSTAIPKTGQTTIFTSGDDGNLQAGVTWPEPRFTDNGNGTITDNLTGLMWLKDANCSDTLEMGTTYTGTLTWQEALDFVKGVNNGTYDISPCGNYTASYTDWRLPSITELESLQQYGQADPAAWLNSLGFQKVQRYDMFSTLYTGTAYWSSTSMGPTSVWGPENAYNITFTATGVPLNIGFTNKTTKLTAWMVRSGVKGPSGHEQPACVRASGQDVCFDTAEIAISCEGTGQDGEHQWGVSWPSPRFTDNNDGTVTDRLTGLVWLKDIACLGQGDFSEALAAVADLNANPGGHACSGYTGSYSDWRLPNIREIASIIDFSQPANRSILPEGHPFLNEPTGTLYFWSSTTYAPSSTTPRAWGGYHQFGNIASLDKENNQYIWPVRGTSSTPPEPRDPDITFSATDLDFGKVVAGCTWDRMLTIGNDGAGDLAIGTLVVQGTDSDDFSIVTDGCTGMTLAPGQSCNVGLRFGQDAAGGNAAAELLIPNNDPDESTTSLNLSGTGVAAVLPASCAPIPDVAADAVRGLGEVVWCLQVLAETRDDGAAGKVNLEDPLHMLRELTDITP